MWQQGLLAAHGRRGGGGELANTPATLTCTHAHPPAAQDVWVNNAALSQGVRAPLANTPATELAAIVDTNLVGGWVGGLLLLAWVLTFTHAPPPPPCQLGALLGARAAIARMSGQPGGGRVFLVDGNGSWGNPTPGNAAYGVCTGCTRLGRLRVEGWLGVRCVHWVH